MSITARAVGAESHDVSFVPQSQPVVYRTDAAVNGPVSVGCQLQSRQVRKKYNNRPGNIVNAVISCVSGGHAAKYAMLSSFQRPKRTHFPVESRQANAFSGCVTGHRVSGNRIENQNK